LWIVVPYVVFSLIRLLFIYHCSLQIERYSMTTSSGGTKFTVQPQHWGIASTWDESLYHDARGSHARRIIWICEGHPYFAERREVYADCRCMCYGTSDGPSHTARNNAAFFGCIYCRTRSNYRSSVVAGGARHKLKWCSLPSHTIYSTVKFLCLVNASTRSFC
jgi:hypothetical protein